MTARENGRVAVGGAVKAGLLIFYSLNSGLRWEISAGVVSGTPQCKL